MLPILACLATVHEKKTPLSTIARSYGFRVALSDRLQNIPQEASTAFLALLEDADKRASLFPAGDAIVRVETIDGVKLFFQSGNAVHYRASGNAPELRCYVESSDDTQAAKLQALGLEIARKALKDATRP